MAQNIEMNVNLTGSDVAIKSMNDLKDFIKEGKDELKKLEVGSEAFNTLAENIGEAEGKLDTLNEKLKKLKVGSASKEFKKLGRTITGSFAMATGALAVFGAKSENLQKLQTRVQGAIALALGMRELAESKVNIAVI